MSTAAPKKNARIKITVKDDRTGERLLRASASLFTINDDQSYQVHWYGDTDDNGEVTSRGLLPGNYELQVVYNGYAPTNVPPPKPSEADVAYRSSVVLAAPTKKVPMLLVEVRMVQTKARARITVNNGQTPIHGAEITITAQDGNNPAPSQADITVQARGMTRSNGLFVSPGIMPGKWWIVVQKPGYTPVRQETAITIPDSTADVSQTVSLTDSMGKVTNSNVQVKSKAFPQWFNSDFQPLHKDIFKATISTSSFNAMFNNLSKLYATEMTIEQFIGIFLIVYNETGGTFEPIPETSSPKRCFEANGKKSYNVASNYLAGDQLMNVDHKGDMLVAKGYKDLITTEDEKKKWNSQTWPNPDEASDLFKAAKECDFYKFRGHGYIQLTFRGAYLSFVSPHLTTYKLKGLDEMTDAELTQTIQTHATLKYDMVRSYIRNGAIHPHYLNTNEHRWYRWALSVAGLNASDYGRLLQNRARTLLEAMVHDGITLPGKPQYIDANYSPNVY